MLNNIFRKQLAIRTGIFIAVGSMVPAIFLTCIIYFKTYNAELSSSQKRISELNDTISHSAAIATYLNNTELAKDIVRGLENNSIVSGVLISSNTGMIVAGKQTVTAEDEQARKFTLRSPFDTSEIVGQIVIRPNQKLIEQAARKIALDYVASIMTLSLLLVGLVILIVHRLLASPLKQLALSLHEISPGSPQRLAIPAGHEKDEIGLLVNDTNWLLDSVKKTLESERKLRTEIEIVGRQFRLIFENASGGIVLTDVDGTIRMFNPTFKRIVSSTQFQDNTCANEMKLSDLFTDPSLVSDALQRAIHTPGLDMELELCKTHKDGPRWIHGFFSPVHESEDHILIECILYDVSRRAKREQKALLEAEQDQLTSLLNRRGCKRYVTPIFERARNENDKIGVFLIDLDNFKPINDSFGHDAGDHVLKEVAQRLHACVRSQDLVVRWGGDEFVIVMSESAGTFKIRKVAERIIEKLGKDIFLDSQKKVTIGASIGISVFPDQSKSFTEAIASADAAMYASKKKETNSFNIYKG